MELFETLAALVPLPRFHLVRSGGCLAPHRHLRGAILPTPRQHGGDEAETDTEAPRWSWARLVKRVCALEMARCRPEARAEGYPAQGSVGGEAGRAAGAVQGSSLPCDTPGSCLSPGWGV
jgi:hypothetical protein